MPSSRITATTKGSSGLARTPSDVEGSTINDPVYVEEGVKIRNSTVGPNVSIGAGTTIEDSSVSHAIIGNKAKISKSALTNSLVGDEVVLVGVKGEVTVGDHSEVRIS